MKHTHYNQYLQKYIIIATIIIIVLLQSCGTITRTEEDLYTISERDTTTLYEIKNAPGNRDNGVVFPSSRTLKSERYLLQRDSLVKRDYPDFIRMSVFESVGLFFSGPNENNAGTGIFGIFPDFKNMKVEDKGSSDNIFAGAMYRFLTGEWRLRWFQDAQNWTFGTSVLEVIAPDARIEKTLVAYMPLYIRKRYFISEKIPYLSFTPAFGIGYYPSQYINVSGSLDFGSLAGLNIRAYLGFAAGTNSASTPQVRSADSSINGKSYTSVFPYAGIGISLLDFLNLVPETKQEWKYHQHSAWNIGLIQVGGIATNSKKSIFSDDTSNDNSSLVNGFLLRLGVASIAIPVLNNQFYAGTSLISIAALGKNEWGAGILPLRIGYWQTVLADELTTEPFIEFSYYPSTVFHIGNKLNLRISEMLNINFIFGYVSSNTSNDFGSDIIDELGDAGNFSKFYLGFGIGLFDKIFYPKDLRYK